MQARYAVMLDQSKNAQGDFARTADGLANSMKIADAEVANLKVQLGELTIKPYTVVVHVIASGLEQLNTDLAALSGDKAIRLPALQKQLADLQASYTAALANGVDATGPAMTQLAGSIAAISAELRDAKSNAEIAGDAGVSAAMRTAAAMYAANSASADWGDAGVTNALRIAAAAEVAAAKVRSITTVDNRNRAPAGPAYGTGTDFAGQLMAAQKATEVVTSQTAAEVQKAHDDAVSAELDRISQTQSAAEKAADAIKAKWSAFASTVTKALDDASNKAKGLFDLGGGGGAGGVITEPGKGGPFEALYRITDIAATMAGRAPGADTAKWQEMYAGQDAMGIARNFQQGNLLAPGVFENIDWNMLGQQATQQEQASKISSYAGQAVANLTQAGKPLTAEAVKAEIDKLAEKDKASLVPELQNVAKTVTDTGATAHTDAGDVVLRLDSVISALNKTAPAPTTTAAHHDYYAACRPTTADDPALCGGHGSGTGRHGNRWRARPGTGQSTAGRTRLHRLTD